MTDGPTNTEAARQMEIEVVAQECLHSFNELGITLLPSSRKVKMPRTLNETALNAAMTLIRTLPMERINIALAGKPPTHGHMEMPTLPIDVAHEILSMRDALGAFLHLNDPELKLDKDLSIGDALAVARSRSLLEHEGHPKVLADHYVKKSPAAVLLSDKIKALPPLTPNK